MLLECLDGLRGNRLIESVRAFFRSVYFVVLVAALMVVSNFFGMELAVFYFYMFLGLLVILFDDDMLHLMPIFLCCYMCISMRNNPAANGDSVFYDPSFQLQFIFIIAIALVLIATRLISVLLNGKKRKLPALAIGFLCLGLGYILGGLFTPYYDLRTAFFGFVQVASLSGLYFLFYYGVDWEKADKEYFAKMFTVIACGLVLETIWMYIESGELANFLAGNGIDRTKLVTGWGVYNNVGALIAILLPAPLYLAATKKHGFLYALLALAVFLGLCLTQSRGATLLGSVPFAVGVVLVLVWSKGKERKHNIIAVASGAGALLLAVVLTFTVPALRDAFGRFFNKIVETGTNGQGRIDLYKEGLEQFSSSPFFGVGFYQCGQYNHRWGDLPTDAFLPVRYHNTYVQLLASGGIFATVCYLLHRAETLVLLFRKPTKEKTFLFLCMLALILTSLLDCHFFNMGPGLFYGVILVWAECAALPRKN